MARFDAHGGDEAGEAESARQLDALPAQLDGAREIPRDLGDAPFGEENHELRRIRIALRRSLGELRKTPAGAREIAVKGVGTGENRPDLERRALVPAALEELDRLSAAVAAAS